MSAGKEVVVCMYTAKPGKEEELEALVLSHWPVLKRIGLSTDEPARVLRGLDGQAGTHAAGGKLLEIFSWKSPESMGLAHQSPEVMAIWEKIGECCSEMDFPGYVHLV